MTAARLPDRQAGPLRQVRVWDLPVRVLHWALAAGVAASWWTSTAGNWHERLGYACCLVVALRLVWGFAGNPYARFRQFLKGPRATWAYTLRVMRGQEERHLGHNPLGGWMAASLWLCVAATCATGWLYTTDAYFGEAWLDQLHQALAWAVVVLVVLHLAGVVFTSLRHRENLVGAMVTGRKRADD